MRMFEKSEYRALTNQVFIKDEYQLVPIRYNDRLAIMKWRNDQIDYLRQAEPLTPKGQDKYFNEVVSQLFLQENPKQILFSFLEKGNLIGYGGLVHINWLDQNAEISFLLNSDLNDEESYKHLITIFLELITEVGIDLELHKIYTYGYDIEEYRFEPLIKRKFDLEAVLRDHVIISNQFVDVKIYAKIL